VVQSFPLGPAGAALHARLCGGAPADDDDLAETTYTLEVEQSGKHTPVLRNKLDRAARLLASNFTPLGRFSGSSEHVPSQTAFGTSESTTHDGPARSSCPHGTLGWTAKTSDRFGDRGG
jgi:hypothetical protein